MMVRYNILCFGASADEGAKAGGILVLSKADQIKILVGQQGMNCYKRAALGGRAGGGGSFVVFHKNSESIRIAAGGYGACYLSGKVGGIDGLTIQAESRDNVKTLGGLLLVVMAWAYQDINRNNIVILRFFNVWWKFWCIWMVAISSITATYQLTTNFAFLVTFRFCVPTIKLNTIRLKIITVKFESVILILESLKYEWGQI